MIKVHWYELVYRGISGGTQPKKNLVVSEPNHVNHKGREYGAVGYSEPLTEEQIADYELRPIASPRELFDYEIGAIELMIKHNKLK